MKKLVFVGLLASICLVTIGQTQLQKGSNGSIRLEPAESVQYQNLGIVISKEAKEYVSFAKQAIEKKGDTISVGTTTNKFVGMAGLFHAKIVKEYSRLKYARKREFVDQEISSRIGIDVSRPIEVPKL